MKTFELTCVSHDGSVGTMQIEAATSEGAIAEMNTYPAVKYVLACQEVNSAIVSDNGITTTKKPAPLEQRYWKGYV